MAWVVLAALAAATHGIILEERVRSHDAVNELVSFAYFAGGTIEFAATPAAPPPVYYIAACSQTWLDRFLGLPPVLALVARVFRAPHYPELANLCGVGSEALLCESRTKVNTTDGVLDRVRVTVPTPEIYTVFAVACPEGDGDGAGLRVDVDLELRNVNGEHLDVLHDPLPVVYSIMAALWALIAGRLVRVLFAVRKSRASERGVSYMMIVLLALKLCVVLLEATFWWGCSTTGRCDNGLRAVIDVLDPMARLLLLLLLAVLVKGLTITRTYVLYSEAITLVSMALSWVVIMVLIGEAARAFRAALILWYALFAYLLFRDLSATTTQLRTLFGIIDRSTHSTAVATEDSPVVIKRSTYRTLRMCLATFCVLEFTRVMLAVLQGIAWMAVILHEGTEIYLMSHLTVLFRARDYEPYLVRLQEYFRDNPDPERPGARLATENLVVVQAADAIYMGVPRNEQALYDKVVAETMARGDEQSLPSPPRARLRDVQRAATVAAIITATGADSDADAESIADVGDRELEAMGLMPVP